MPLITKEWLKQNKTARGGYCSNQLRVLREIAPVTNGWFKTLIGMEITESQQRRFVEAGKIGKRPGKKAKKPKFDATPYQASPEMMEPKKASKRNKYLASDEFLVSYEWRKLRMEAIKLHGTKCQCCGATPKDGIVINVDHVKPRKLFPELALSLNNLQILCNVCNHGKGNWDDTDWREQ